MWEDAYLTAKRETASGTLNGPQTLGLQTNVSQTKSNEQIRPLIFSAKQKVSCIFEIGRIFHIQIDIL